VKQVETDYLREKKLYEIDEELFYTIDESGHSAEMTEKAAPWYRSRIRISSSCPSLSDRFIKLDTDPGLTPQEKAENAKKCIGRMRSGRAHPLREPAFCGLTRCLSLTWITWCRTARSLLWTNLPDRILHGRRWERRACTRPVEAKEGVKICGENQTLATITFQNFFKMYGKISGMTGTAITEAGEFNEIYKLDVVTVPTYRPMRRTDYEDEIYRTNREKYAAW